MNILTIKETMVELKSGRSFTYKLIGNGELKVFKMGNRTMCTSEYVEEYLNNCKRASGLIVEGDVVASQAEPEYETETQEAA